MWNWWSCTPESSKSRRSRGCGPVLAKIIILVAHTLLPPGIFFRFFFLIPGIYDNRSKWGLLHTFHTWRWIQPFLSALSNTWKSILLCNRKRNEEWQRKLGKVKETVDLCHGPPHTSPGPLRHCSAPQEARPDPNWQERNGGSEEEEEHQGGKTRAAASEKAKREMSTCDHMLDHTGSFFLVDPYSGFKSFPMIWNRLCCPSQG